MTMINVKAERERERKKNEKEAEDMAQLYKDLFLSPVGQKVLKNLMGVCGTDADAFSENPTKMAYQVGRQSVRQHIKLMLKEKQNK